MEKKAKNLGYDPSTVYPSLAQNLEKLGSRF